MALSIAHVVTREPLMAMDAKWIALFKYVPIYSLNSRRIVSGVYSAAKRHRIAYIGADNERRIWESAERTTRPKNGEVDGVGIIAILEKPSGPELLLQRQFRPAVNKVCIEIPAGLIDDGETAEECAVRELQEETGYVGRIIMNDLPEGSPIIFNDPGFCNTNLNVVHLLVDMNDPRNQNPTPQLEEDEFIECFSVPLTTLYTEYLNLASQGFGIDARVGTLAEGIELARRWNLFEARLTHIAVPESV